ncbi:hypothetical protein [Yinghuangia soli]|uniref:Uncharacterized protein n=1 Tax=Yinghuangia soli TaxID=2908204 RepID=A0AA41PY76_9ACTN|nr:hypothetical protein [Yinghuangia soli]MCF2527004.1 hypothetical protein [Yinghuangia soli]
MTASGGTGAAGSQWADIVDRHLRGLLAAEGSGPADGPGGSSVFEVTMPDEAPWVR